MIGDNDRNAALSDIEILTRQGDELIERIERDTTDVQRMQKPAADGWSLTEVVQHLSLVANGTLRTARPSGRRAPLIGRAKSALLRCCGRD